MKKYILALLALVTCLSTLAQEPTRIIVPFPPGGAPDTFARIIQPQLSKQINQILIVDNKPGAGGEIGHKELADSVRPTLGATTLSVSINTIKSTPPYDLEKIIPVAYVAVPTVIIASHKSNIKNIQDVKNYRNLKVGTLGYGTTLHIITEKMTRDLNNSIIQIPFKGAPQLLQSLIAGDIDVGMVGISQAIPLIADNRIFPLAVDYPQRVSSLPNVPTFTEFELKQVSNLSYSIIVANSTTSNTEITKIQTAMKEILQDPNTIEKLNKSGFIVLTQPIPPRNWLMQERSRFVSLMKNLNIVPIQ
jgi:tripartite-type tricarboxylate transporter receptor subunit TctC